MGRRRLQENGWLEEPEEGLTDNAAEWCLAAEKGGAV